MENCGAKPGVLGKRGNIAPARWMSLKAAAATPVGLWELNDFERFPDLARTARTKEVAAAYKLELVALSLEEIKSVRSSPVTFADTATIRSIKINTEQRIFKKLRP